MRMSGSLLLPLRLLVERIYPRDAPSFPTGTQPTKSAHAAKNAAKGPEQTTSPEALKKSKPPKKKEA